MLLPEKKFDRSSSWGLFSTLPTPKHMPKQAIFKEAHFSRDRGGVSSLRRFPPARPPGFDFSRPRLGRQAVQHAVDVFVAVGSAESLG
jgi:hypothetical protein